MGFPRRAHARLRCRRGLIAILALVAAAPMAAAPLSASAAPFPTNALPGSAPLVLCQAPAICLLSHDQWAEPPLGTMQRMHFVGQIQNKMNRPITNVAIHVDWTDTSNGNAVTHTSTLTSRTVLANNDYAPFDDTEVFPAGDVVNAVETSITWAVPTDTPYYLTATATACGAANDEVCGQVKNNYSTNQTPVPVTRVSVILTYIDTTVVPSVVRGTDTWSVDTDSNSPVFNVNDTGHFDFARIDPYATNPGITIVADAEPAYPMQLYPASVDVGPVNANKTGQRDLAVYDNGLPFTISAVQTQPAEFTWSSSDCLSNSGVPTGTSCHITVKFSPTAQDIQNGLGTPIQGTLTLTDNAAGSTQSIPISGTPAAPAVRFSGASIVNGPILALGHAPAGGSGVRKAVTITNVGNGPLTLTGASTDDPHDFSVDASHCPINAPNSPSPLALDPGQQCDIGVTFMPWIGGPYGNQPFSNAPVADLVLNDDAGTGMQALPLTGFGDGPGALLLLGSQPVTRLDFGHVPQMVTSSPLTIRLLNNGSQPLAISAITIGNETVTGDFQEVDNCGPIPGSLAPNNTFCSIILTFKPQTLGPAGATLTISDNAGTGTQTVNLSGTGVTLGGRRTGSGVRRGFIPPAT